MKNANKFLLFIVEFNKNSEEAKEEFWSPFANLTKPQWIRKVEINHEEIKNDVNILMTEKWVDEWEDFISSFMSKIKEDIKIRETFNKSRVTVKNSNHIESPPCSYMDTITRFQEFFGLDANCDLIDRDSIEWNQNQEEESEEEDIRKSVVVWYEEVEDEEE